VPCKSHSRLLNRGELATAPRDGGSGFPVDPCVSGYLGGDPVALQIRGPWQGLAERGLVVVCHLWICLLAGHLIRVSFAERAG
jgi:hypothetical protein